MPKLKLNQEAPFQLVGVCLVPETHEYSLDAFEKLDAEPSFHLTVATGLIEIIEAPSKAEPKKVPLDEAVEGEAPKLLAKPRK